MSNLVLAFKKNNVFMCISFLTIQYLHYNRYQDYYCRKIVLAHKLLELPLYD